MADARLQGVFTDDKGFSLVVFPAGEAHAQQVYLSHEDQLLVANALLQRFASRALLLESVRQGRVVPSQEAP